MVTVEQFLDALAQVESSNNPEAWGYGGRAMGRWQVHPDALWTFAHLYSIKPLLGETWDHLVNRIVTALYNDNAANEEPRAIAMRWHVGHWTYPSRPEWDLVYEEKFNDALARALGQAVT